MWGGNGDGGFNTSYGGDDGAGFGTQQFSSQGGEAKKSGRRIEKVVPLTIRTVLDLDENKQEYCGTEIHMVSIVGLIREVDVSSTKIAYTVNDTTGTIKVIKWLDSDMQEEPLMENTYCRVHGTFKTHNTIKQILALHLEPITDLNWITAHILEVIHTALKLKQLREMDSSTGFGKDNVGATGEGNGVMSNSLMGFNNMGGGTSGMMSNTTGFTKIQKAVFDVIQAASHENSDCGCSREDVKMKLKGRVTVTPQQIDNTIFYLTNEGHIYTTTDENHFKTTDS